MFVVGLTGGIGSGKTTVANLFSAQGIELVDTDQLAHAVVAKGEPALTAIAEHFGTDALLPDGNLDRTALRAKVFNQPDERQWLEGLIHPLVRQRLLQGLKDAKSDYVMLVSPLLLETDQHLLTDHIVVIDVPESVQIERTLARDNTDEAGVKAIISAQISRQDRLAKADTIIDNTQPMERLITEVKRLDELFRKLAKSVD